MGSPVASSGHLTLRRASRLSVWGQIGVRTGLVFALLAFVILVHWLEREGLKDNLDGHVSFVDVIYFTMISGTTTGYGDIVPVTDRARLFDALVVTPIRIFFVLIFVGTAYQLVLRRSWERWRMARLQEKLSNHIIIAGFGTSGNEALDELSRAACRRTMSSSSTASRKRWTKPRRSAAWCWKAMPRGTRPWRRSASRRHAR
jgi:voltage-gated potassium channel